MKRENPTTYTPPEVDIYAIECADIITTSGNNGFLDGKEDTDW